VVDSIVAVLGIYAGTLAVGVLSGLIPLINGEVFLVAVVLATKEVAPAIALAVLVAAGQMIAKAILYHAANKTGGKLGPKIARARERIAKWKDKPNAVTFISGLTSIPPFYLVTLAAGALGVRFRTFMILGTIGRIIHFVVLALLTLLV
jgi:membrane protein YqaA with SNARE-associated domain